MRQFTYVITVIFALFTSVAMAEDITDQMNSINTQVEAISTDVTDSINLLNGLTLDGSGGQDGEAMIDKTIESLNQLEKKIGDKSALVQAIDSAIKQVELKEKKMAETALTVDNDLKQQLMDIKEEIVAEKDKINAQKGQVSNMHRKLIKEIRTLKQQKKLFGLLVDRDKIVRARKSIEKVVSGLKTLEVTFKGFSVKPKSAPQPE
jgi:Mg2+ and Co2+ transporter CorA